MKINTKHRRHDVNMEDPITLWKKLPQRHLAHRINNGCLVMHLRISQNGEFLSLPPRKALTSKQLFCKCALKEQLLGGEEGGGNTAEALLLHTIYESLRHLSLAERAVRPSRSA